MFGSAMMSTGGNVAADHRPDRLGPLPTDVALMGIWHQRQPVAARFAADLHAGTVGSITCCNRRLTIGISAAVDGVLDHAVDGGVVRPPPSHIAIVLLHRQIEMMLVEPEQSLAGAAQFLNLVEDESNSVLHAAVRILLVTIAGLHEADRRRDHQFAAARLLVARRERTLAQQVKLVLVQAALQSEQQPVVAMARRVDGLLIDQHRVDHATHLDQLLPVAAVAGKAGDFARADGANLAEAYLRDHPLEAGTLNGARRRAAEIVVDHFDLRPAKPRQSIPHGILQRAALP